MKILFYIILSVLFPFQMIMGQTGKDSILFRGNIVYDGDASEATFLHELYIKHNPKQRYPIVCDSDLHFVFRSVEQPKTTRNTQA